MKYVSPVRIVLIFALLSVCFGAAGLLWNPNPPVIEDGLSFTMSPTGDRLIVKLAEDVWSSPAIAIPSSDIATVRRGERSWLLDGRSADQVDADKAAIPSFDRIVCLSPGMEVSYACVPQPGGYVLVQISGVYQKDFEKFAAAHRVRLWAGKVIVPLP